MCISEGGFRGGMCVFKLSRHVWRGEHLLSVDGEPDDAFTVKGFCEAEIRIGATFWSCVIQGFQMPRPARIESVRKSWRAGGILGPIRWWLR